MIKSCILLYPKLMQSIKVAVGIIFKQDKVLLTKRLKGKFMSDFWEFAGGKIENGESDIQALKREFYEELGISVENANFLKTLVHKYPTKIVILDVFIITKYSGEISSKEGQEVSWVDIDKVEEFNILPTVLPLLNFANLPQIYWITPEPEDNIEWFNLLDNQIKKNIKLIQLRFKNLPNLPLVKKVYKICQQNKVKLMINTNKKVNNLFDFCDGIHLNSRQLNSLNEKNHLFMSASTHNIFEAKKAESLGIDFIVISPVLATKSHPNTKPIGLESAQEIALSVNIPVYFLGGMNLENLAPAIKHNAFGIAGISLI